MTVSLTAFSTAVLCAMAVAAIGCGALLSRRLHRPRPVQAAAVGAAALLVPANLYAGENPVPQAAGLAVHVATLAAVCGVVGFACAVRIGPTTAPRPRRVLAIGAHPDDLELGCGGTIAKLADSGHEVRGLVMSQGESGGSRAARPCEAVNGGRYVGAAGVQVLAFTDTELADQEADLAVAIEAAIRRFNPDILLTHSANDQHQDHRAVHRATLRAARQHSSILCYESPSATSAFQPSVFVDISDYVEVKTAAVRAHADQRAKPYMAPERVRGLAVFRGAQARTGRAEGYEPVRLLTSPGADL